MFEILNHGETTAKAIFENLNHEKITTPQNDRSTWCRGSRNHHSSETPWYTKAEAQIHWGTPNQAPQKQQKTSK